jgi:hypothetical protein
MYGVGCPIRDVQALRPKTFACAYCGAEFTPRRNSARFCSVRCRVAAHRARAKGGNEVTKAAGLDARCLVYV